MAYDIQMSFLSVILRAKMAVSEGTTINSFRDCHAQMSAGS